MEIYKIRFNASETDDLYAQALAAVLLEGGRTVEEAKELISTLTPQNIVRLALGFEPRKRGGARLNTGNRKAEK